MMTYGSFRQQVRELLEREFPDARVILDEVQKNNDTTEWGLTIHKKGENMSPTFYLEPYYHAYEKGMTGPDGTARDIAHRYRTLPAEIYTGGRIPPDFENVKSRIIMEVLEIKRNQDTLSRRVYQPIGNGMAKAFRVLVEQTEEGTATLAVTREIAEAFSYPPAEELARLADENTPRLLPVTWQTLDEAIGELLGRDKMPDRQTNQQGLYVLSNDSHLRGAASLYYPGMQEQIREWVGGDYWVLPSSTHEVLILPATADFRAEELQEIVRTINESQVAEVDCLSDHVMYYDAVRKLLNMPLTHIPAGPQIPVDTASPFLRSVLKEASALPGNAEKLLVPMSEHPPLVINEFLKETGRLGVSAYVDLSGDDMDLLVDRRITDQFDMTQTETKHIGKSPEKRQERTFGL